jgi:hypothetical protein
MKRFFSGLVVAVVVLTFIVCVYCYGKDQRFSFEYYLENLQYLQTTNYLTAIAAVWSNEDAFLSWSFANGDFTLVSLDPYTGDNDILQFFDTLRLFFIRCGNTGIWLAKALQDMLHNFKYLLPWNAVVHPDGTRIPINAGGVGGDF